MPDDVIMVRRIGMPDGSTFLVHATARPILTMDVVFGAVRYRVDGRTVNVRDYTAAAKELRQRAL